MPVDVGPVSAMPPRLTQVGKEQSELLTTLNELHETIDSLYARLADSVLRDEPTNFGAVKQVNQPNAPMVPLAVFLSERKGNVLFATEKIRNIISRLEV